MFLPEYDHFPFLFPQVTYQSDQFLDKNKDYVVAEHQELLNASKCPFVSGLFPPATEENTKSSKSSIATRFKVTFLHQNGDMTTFTLLYSYESFGVHVIVAVFDF